MITGITLSSEELKQLNLFKDSVGYANYIKDIALSPAYKHILKQNIDSINVSNQLKEITHGTNLGSDDINGMTHIIKNTLSEFATRIMADAVILKELETLKIDDVINDINEDDTIKYYLGLAKEEYYVKVKEMIDKKEIDEHSMLYKGYSNWLKRNGPFSSNELNKINSLKKKKKSTPKLDTKPCQEVDLDSDTIEL